VQLGLSNLNPFLWRLVNAADVWHDEYSV